MSISIGRSSYTLSPFSSYCGSPVLPSLLSISLQISRIISPSASALYPFLISSSYSTTAFMNLFSESNPHGSVSIMPETVLKGVPSSIFSRLSASSIFFLLSPWFEPRERYNSTFSLSSLTLSPSVLQSSSPSSTSASSDILLLSHTGSKTRSILTLTTPGTSSTAVLT